MNIVVIDGKAYPYRSGRILINPDEYNKLAESQKKTFQIAQGQLLLQPIPKLGNGQHITRVYNTRK